MLNFFDSADATQPSSALRHSATATRCAQRAFALGVDTEEIEAQESDRLAGFEELASPNEGKRAANAARPMNDLRGMRELGELSCIVTSRAVRKPSMVYEMASS
jgi:hypothetical protein